MNKNNEKSIFNVREFLDKEVKTESELKNLIVDYVGNKIDPEDDKVTVEQTIEIFAKEFPEFLLVIAEENWVNGYTQALRDVEFASRKEEKENKDFENDRPQN